MKRAPNSLAVCVIACLAVSADDVTWKNKSPQQWTPEEARQILRDSPWSKPSTPQWLRDLSVDERRNSGNMEATEGHGVGIAGIGILGPSMQAEAIARAHAKPDPGEVVVRWESAQPVRMAAEKAGEIDAPAISSEYYAIAVHNVLTPRRWNLENELKGIAGLTRTRKKDLRPARVVILRKDKERATVVYLFPRSVEIGLRDGNMTFYAQIGRLFVEQVFYIPEMQIAGQLEL